MTHTLYGLDAEGHLVHQDAPCRCVDKGATLICQVSGEAGDRDPVLFEVILAPYSRAELPLALALCEKTIYILEGTLAVRLGDQTFTVGATDVVQVAPDVSYAAWNPTSSTVRYLALVNPVLSKL